MVLDNPKEYGLQKPVDKVEPKFKIGDWIIDNNIKTPFLITGISNEKYDVISIYGNDMAFSFHEVEHFYHLWSVQDAEDGDVLVDEGSNIGIYKEIEGLCWHSYIYLGNNNRLYGFSIGGSHMQNNTKPATKEQRDLLSQKMKEAGYEWDAEKKELKKIEQKQERIDEDKKNYQMIQKIICDSDITAKMANKLSDWLKDLKEKMQPQPKEEWSVDDEDMHYKAIAVINRLCAEGKDYVWSIKTLKKLFYWLKSLKVRVQPQPKEEWSEDDEYYYGIIQYIINDDYVGKTDKKNANNWFKSFKDRIQSKKEWSEEEQQIIKDAASFILSCVNTAETKKEEERLEELADKLQDLRAQNRWKPSDEQIETLKYACGGNYVNLGILDSLYNDLKKLRDE